MLFAQSDDAQSYNDRGVDAIENRETSLAIQSFERAIRHGGKEARLAKKNMAAYRKDLDLPEHTLLHFGWSNGIGQIAHGFIKNGWILLSLMILIGMIVLYFLKRPTFNRFAVAMLIAALLTGGLSLFRSKYINAEGLMIIKADADLKVKPYDVSDEKQTVFEGQMCTIISSYEEFYEVQTDTYESGWMRKDDLMPIW